MQHRNRTKQTTSLEDGRAAFEGNVRERALQLPHAPNRKSVLRRLSAPRRRIRKTGPVCESCNHQNNAAPPLGTSPRAQTYSQAGIETCSQVSSSKPAGAAVRGGGSVSCRVPRRRPESIFLIATVSRHINHNRVGRYFFTDGHGLHQ